MAVEVQNLVQQIQEQVLKGVEDFYGKSLSSLESRLKDDRSQLEELLEQLPNSQEDMRTRIEQLVASYEAIGESLQVTAQQQGVEGVLSQAVQQTQEAAGRATQQAQVVAGQATEQVQETAGQATQGARGAAAGALGQAQEGAVEATEQVQGLVGQVTEAAEKEPNATKGAKRKAEELGVNLHEIAVSGSDRLITLKDVMSAAMPRGRGQPS